jgi:phage minor structural protein
MLKILNSQRQPLAILENAYDKSLEREVNQLWYFSFSMPIDDEKNIHCQHYNYVEVVSKTGRNYGLYRIMPIETKKHENYIKYQCEHVLATLLDTVIDGFQSFTNLSTRTALESLLAMQDEQQWVLGECDFNMMFSYGFENENGLLAPILSIPKPFVEPYEFTCDTSVFPWVLNLKRASMDVRSEYRWGKDILEFNEHVDPTEIVNYLIPKGSGEGVNQLTIKDVNGGKNYLKDDESIAKWGKRPYIHIDRRFTQADSLKGYAENLLNDWKEPKFSIEVKAADLSILPGYEHEQRFLNTASNVIVENKVYVARIIGEKIKDIDREQEVDYALGNKLGDIAESSAEYERKVSVNEAYSQGATNLLQLPFVDNCDPTHPAIIRFKTPDDLMQYNSMLLTFETQPFRAYNRAIEGGGSIATSTASGGSSNQTSSSGGSVSTSTASGGGSSQTSSSGGSTTVSSSTVDFNGNTLATGLPVGSITPPYEQHYHLVTLQDNQLQHNHSVSIGNHTHTVPIPSHTHNFTVPSHTHTVNIPSHTHDLTLPDHTHDIEFGIFELSESPTSVTIEVDGNPLPFNATSGDNIDLIPYLDLDESGKIRRGQYVEIKITPNALARINASVESRLFINSHVGGNY